jgi:hypothetical protein
LTGSKEGSVAMTEPALIARQRALLRDLLRRAAERERNEPAIEATFREQLATIESEYTSGCEAVRQRFATEQQANESAIEQARLTIGGIYKGEQDAAEKEHAQARANILDQAQTEETAQSTYQEACWTVDTVLEGAEAEAKKTLRENKTRLAKRMDSLRELQAQARALLERWKQPAQEIEEAVRTAKRPDKTAPPKLSESLGNVQGLLRKLQRMILPRLLRGGKLIVLMVLVWAAAVWPLGMLAVQVGRRQDTTTLAGTLTLGLIVSSLVLLPVGPAAHFLLTAMCRSRVRRLYGPICRIVEEAEATRKVLLERYDREFRQGIADSKKHHDEEMERLSIAFKQQLAVVQRWREQALRPVEERYQQQKETCEKRRASNTQKTEELYRRRRVEIQKRHDEGLRQLTARREQLLKETHQRHTSDYNALVADWRHGMAELKAVTAEINETMEALAPRWAPDSGWVAEGHWQKWQPPTAVPPVLRLGRFQVRLADVQGGIPIAEELRAVTPDRLDMPALGAFPQGSSLLLEAGEAGLDGADGRAAAVQVFQAVLFRLLTSLPPGDVRFVIVDPVGLGQNFAAFMHLADYDEMLVASRIWTETPHIEHRLADLTLHMENVIQKYLRNRYESITDYNEEAGEVAEAFRVLVIANFPTNFSPDAIRRLISINQSGPRCGVLTLISVDSKQSLPKDFNLADLEQNSSTFAWNGERFVWKDPDFGPYPLALDAPPDNELVNRILAQVGEGARSAKRVEVPFEFIAPTPAEWWSADSRKGLRVALGRAGATQRQCLDLGKGTSQHALIAGKTGSGKSSLLHALITNLSLMYAPDEVELYLVDFKKGVEFKTYAIHELPHARVIAIESEREFGLSVLQRLDSELKSRGDRFRDARSQDVAGFRQAVPGERMPRILLVVDEFQEFFTEDDRIAQEAAQLLDRLVRQGRAFGMHILLGSQTLGGAYSLARSTIDQMAVRIALQCSEADAHLILSDDNSAARLLSRPGEAIYNDANGLVEGNNPFQVVWLGDDKREEYLERIRELAVQRPPILRDAAVVFEGNAPADVARNHLLRHRLANPPASEDAQQEQLAWLGEAMAINDLTAAAFRRHNGSNLLIVGQQEETVLGMLATAVISLAAQMAGAADEQPRFWVVDGRQADAPSAGPLARLPEIVPQGVRLAGWREVPAIMAEVSAEVERRQKEPGLTAPSGYVVLFGLHRLRDLRRQDDDFGFMRKADEAANPAQQLANVLREGPVLGVHALMWCDTMNNLQRSVDRQSMRELALRVVFQMNVSDSSNLIDTPAASKLGMHRALYFSEEDGRLDKFRPYGLPPAGWLAQVKEQLGRRAEQPAVGARRE